MNRRDLDAIRRSRCVACGDTPCDAAHVRTKKATGINKAHNIIPLCRADHRRQHQLGWSQFFERFPHVQDHLEQKGWSFQTLNGRFLMFFEGEA